LRFRKRDPNGRPPTRRRIEVDPSAKCLHGVANDGQAEPEVARVAAAGPVEAVEDPVLALAWNALPGIRDLE